MRFRPILAAVAVQFLVAQAPPPPVDAAQVEAQIQMMRSELNLEARKVFTLNLPLTESESKAFWPIYAKYELAQSKLSDRRFALLRRYSDAFETMDAKTAKALEDDSYDIQKKDLALRHNCFLSLSKVLDARKAARWLQIETTLRNVRALRAAASVPLLKTE